MLNALVFHPEAAMPPKTLAGFRKDAGWVNGSDAAQRGAAGPGGLVRWATVRFHQKIIAIARLELAPPQFCYVSDLIVLGAYRGRGVGEWLMEHIERHCLELAVPRVLLQPEAGSRAFYEKLHFVPDPLAAGFMKKELLPARRGRLPF